MAGHRSGGGRATADPPRCQRRRRRPDQPRSVWLITRAGRAGRHPVPRRVPAPLPGRQAGPWTCSTTCARPCSPRCQRLDGGKQDALRTGQVVSRANTDLQLVQGCCRWCRSSVGDDRAGGGVAGRDAVALAAADADRAGRRARAGHRGGPSRRKLFPATWSAQQRAADIAQHVEETVTGVRVVKGFGQETREIGQAGAGRPGGCSRSGCGRRGCSRGRTRRCRRCRRWARSAVLALGGWLALRGADQHRHVPGVRHLRRDAGRSRPDAVRPGDHGPDGARGRRAGVRAGRLAAGDRGRARRAWTCRPGRSAVVPGRRPLRLHAQRTGAGRRVAARRAGRDARADRHVRVGQVDGFPAAAPVLRRAGRFGASRPPGHAVDIRSAAAVVAAPHRRRGVRGGVPVLRRRSGTTSPTAGRTPPTSEVRRGRAGRRGGRVHQRAARRLRHPGRRARADPVRRAAAADRAGQGAAVRPAGAGAGRRDVGRRRRHRGRDPGHPALGHRRPAPRC